MKKIFKKIKLMLIVICMPSFWIRIGRYSKYWDEIIRSLIDSKQEIDKESYNIHSIKIGEWKIWVSNYPYAFGYLYNCDQLLPSRRTCYLLKKYIEKNGLHILKKEFDYDKKTIERTLEYNKYIDDLEESEQEESE